MQKILKILPYNTKYLLRDDYLDTVAATSVQGTFATPGPGTRVVVTDTGSKISVGSGVLNFATGNSAGDGVWYSSLARLAGRTLIASVTPGSATEQIEVGWDNNTTSAINDALAFPTGSLSMRIQGAAQVAVGAFASSTLYYLACVMRSAGMLYFIKGGAFTNWTLIYPTATGTNAGTPAIDVRGNSVFTADYIRVPVSLVFVTALASDSFNRADAAIGSTDGAGNTEGGGAGIEWAKVGTWNTSTNVAVCATLSSGVGGATVPVGSTNVIVEGVVTRSAGNAGFYLRYTDASNYIYSYLDGTSLITTEVVTGTPNNLGTTAVTYGATKRLVISLSGTKIRAYYGDTLVGSEMTTSITTGSNHGLYTSDTGATFNNFVVWAKGNESQYNGLLDKYLNP